MTPVEIGGGISPSSYDLPRDLIVIWRVYLDRTSGSYEHLEATLSRDEAGRASRFHFERDRRRFTIARGVLRTILGGYLKTEPQLLVFDYGPRGKPFLPHAISDIRFNVAHSQELALIAVARERELGVDVEHIRSLHRAEQIPERFFSTREVAALRSMPRHQGDAAFFACWTRKEAYIKARGGGLSIPLDSFSVSLDPGKPATLLEVVDDPKEVLRWDMAELRAASNYAGALVAEGKNWNFSFCDFDPQV